MSRRILIVDDNAAEAVEIKKVVESLGAYQVEMSDSGSDALLRMVESSYDAVIVDLDLGGLSEGKTLLRSMQNRMARAPGTIIVSRMGHHPFARKLEAEHPFVLGVLKKNQLPELSSLLAKTLQKAFELQRPDPSFDEERQVNAGGSGRMRVAGLIFGAATLVFFMSIVTMSLTGRIIPCEGRFPAVMVLALGASLSVGFLGGWAKAEGKVALSGAAGSPIVFGVTGGIAVLIIVLVMGWLLYARSCGAA